MGWKKRRRGFGASNKKVVPPPPPPPPYQDWANYPDSPVLTETYPYQAIINYGGSPYLIVATLPLWISGGKIATSGIMRYGMYVTTSWAMSGSDRINDPFPQNSIYEANSNIYTDVSLTTIHFAKTTP